MMTAKTVLGTLAGFAILAAAICSWKFWGMDFRVAVPLGLSGLVIIERSLELFSDKDNDDDDAV